MVHRVELGRLSRQPQKPDAEFLSQPQRAGTAMGAVGIQQEPQGTFRSRAGAQATRKTMEVSQALLGSCQKYAPAGVHVQCAKENPTGVLSANWHLGLVLHAKPLLPARGAAGAGSSHPPPTACRPRAGFSAREQAPFFLRQVLGGSCKHVARALPTQPGGVQTAT